MCIYSITTSDFISFLKIAYFEYLFVKEHSVKQDIMLLLFITKIFYTDFFIEKMVPHHYICKWEHMRIKFSP